MDLAGLCRNRLFSPTISSAGHTLQGPVTKMTWACKGAAEHVAEVRAKCCQDLPRFAQIYHDLPRFTTICRFQPCGFKAFPDPNSSTSAMECRDFLAANFNGDQLRTFFLQLMMHLATFKRMAWRTEFYNQWKDLHSGTGIS